MFYAGNSRKCTECGAKLSTRNLSSRKKQFTNLCQQCFSHPPPKYRCNATTAKGTRCGLRVTSKFKKFCSLHSRSD